MENVEDGIDVTRSDLEQGHHNKEISGCSMTAWNEVTLVRFGENEAQNPLNWTKKRKWGVTAAASGTALSASCYRRCDPFILSRVR